MKKASAILAIFGVLALTGAGCSNNAPESTSPTSTEGNNSTTSTVETPSNESTSTEDLTVKVEKTEEGTIRVSWTAPENTPKTDSFRVMHSARQNVSFGPDQATQPFWFQYMNSARSTELSNVPKGKRYFRVCEYNLEKQECVKYSNEVEFQVE